VDSIVDMVASQKSTIHGGYNRCCGLWRQAKNPQWGNTMAEIGQHFTIVLGTWTPPDF